MVSETKTVSQVIDEIETTLRGEWTANIRRRYREWVDEADSCRPDDMDYPDPPTPEKVNRYSTLADWAADVYLPEMTVVSAREHFDILIGMDIEDAIFDAICLADGYDGKAEHAEGQGVLVTRAVAALLDGILAAPTPRPDDADWRRDGF